MKKLLTVLLTACMLLSVFAVAASADEEETPTVNFNPVTMYAAKGTPEAIDGVMDEAYLKAPAIEVAGGFAREAQKKTKTKVTMRILWDESYLYVFFDITDPYITPEAHEKQWTQDYTALYQFYLGDSASVYLNTSGGFHTDWRSEPGVVGCSVYQGGVNYGLTGNKLYAGAGHAAMWADKAFDEETEPEKKAEADAAREVVNNCLYQTTLVQNENGKTVGWTCEMKIRFENYTPAADDVIGFVAQIDCDDKAAEKGGEGSGNWGTREYSLFSNPTAFDQHQNECYKNTGYFDKLVLALEPDLEPEPNPEPEVPTGTDTEPESKPEPKPETPTTAAPSTPSTPSGSETKGNNETSGTPTDTKAAEKQDGGCSSSVAGIVTLTPILAGFALLKKKKKSK